MTDLSQKKCVPCEGGVPPMPDDEIAAHLQEVDEWRAVEQTKIIKTYEFKDFAAALRFVNQVGEIAEAEGHHPDIEIFGWNKVKITLSTHAIGGLSLNDFIVAAKIDKLGV